MFTYTVETITPTRTGYHFTAPTANGERLYAASITAARAASPPCGTSSARHRNGSPIGGTSRPTPPTTAATA